MNLLMKDIHKSFGKNEVLKGVDFNLSNGEIHALVGENGAGKSTLMNILGGILEMDDGQILVEKKVTDIKTSDDAKNIGIGFIHQELVDWPELTVVENLFMNNEIKNGFRLDNKTMRKKAIEIFERLNIDISPNSLVKDLSVGKRQMLEIAKASMNDINILILDEPTTALTNNEIDKLFSLIKVLKDKGVSMIYITHRMEEIFSLTDRITVMRDGKSVGEFETDATNEREIVEHMVGRDIGDFYPEMTRNIKEEKFAIKNFSREGFFENISINVKSGEIVGIAGLMGAGRSEIFRSVFGIDPKDSGEIFINGSKVEINSPIDAINKKIAFVTENRKEEGLVLDESIRENISLTNFDRMVKSGVINKKKERDFAENFRKSLNIKSTGIEDKLMDLSGGNQQKVVMAKWFGIVPEILILDEPTKGVDVGAKREIYTLINKMTEENVAVILVSSDLPELLSLSDRIYAIYEGKLMGEIDRSLANQEKVMTLATGGKLWKVKKAKNY